MRGGEASAAEKRVSNRVRRVRIQNIVLEVVKLSGVLGVALIAPNALQALRKVDPFFKVKKKPEARIREATRRLVDGGYLVWERDRAGEAFVRLTEKGEEAVAFLEMSSRPLATPKKWDGKWRVIIFDIEEKRRAIRDRVRLFLRSVGLHRLQDSVWIYPYPCAEVIRLLKVKFRLERNLLYLIAEELENDRWLREHFHLPHRES